jgi:hypothetical protein
MGISLDNIFNVTQHVRKIKRVYQNGQLGYTIKSKAGNHLLGKFFYLIFLLNLLKMYHPCCGIPGFMEFITLWALFLLNRLGSNSRTWEEAAFFVHYRVINI